MEIIQGKRTSQMDSAEFHELISSYRTVVVDVGTGDGRFVYEVAQAHPQWFCIGVDPARENLEEYSAKICRQPKRGGLPNALYVIASAEALPSELEGLAGAIHINFPWGSLLEAILLADQQVLGNLGRISSPGASLTMLINASIFHDPIPVRVQGLPELTPAYIDDVLTPAYAEADIAIVESRSISNRELLRVMTTWAKRLAHGTASHTFRVEAVVGLHGRDSRYSGCRQLADAGSP